MLDQPMNDTIMASVAALKSRTQDTSFSLYTGFRSVRKKSAQNVENVDEIASVADMVPGKTTIALAVDTDVLDRLKEHSDDHLAEIRSILRDYVKTRL